MQRENTSIIKEEIQLGSLGSLNGIKIVFFFLEMSLEKNIWKHQRAVKEEMKVTEHKVD